MEGLSERDYAAHSGLSRAAVQKARKNGRLRSARLSRIAGQTRTRQMAH